MINFPDIVHDDIMFNTTQMGVHTQRRQQYERVQCHGDSFNQRSYTAIQIFLYKTFMQFVFEVFLADGGGRDSAVLIADVRMFGEENQRPFTLSIKYDDDPVEAV
jgi:hypothetical protein